MAGAYLLLTGLACVQFEDLRIKVLGVGGEASEELRAAALRLHICLGTHTQLVRER